MKFIEMTGKRLAEVVSDDEITLPTSPRPESRKTQSFVSISRAISKSAARKDGM